MIESDFRWFVDNHEHLYEQYGACYLAIKDKTVLGSYHSCEEGVRETEKSEKLGTFIVQECGPDASSYTSYISSMNFM